MHILMTQRLTLRRPMPLDADDIALWLNRWEVARMLTRVPHPYGVADAEAWIGHVSARPEALVYTIHRERLIGVVSIEGEGPEPMLGYWLAERWHGHGYMTEAARALLAHAFATRALGSVRSAAMVDNPASLRVQRKLGFETCGARKSWCVSREETVTLVDTRLTRAAFAAPALRAEPVTA